MDTLLSRDSVKLLLRVELVGKSSAKIRLNAVHKDYVKKEKSNDYMYFADEYNDFIIWSMQDFIFNERQLRIPDEINIGEKMVHTHEFKHDMERYDSLKKLYKSLNRWAITQDFKKNFDDVMTPRVIIAGNYWYVL